MKQTPSTAGNTRRGWWSARWATLAIAAAVVGALLAAVQPATAATADAPGAPGASATWTTGDKEGLGTSTTVQSKVWYTLTGGTMSEVYYPSGDTPTCGSCSSRSPTESRSPS
jgi:Glucodextranase, domain N